MGGKTLCVNAQGMCQRLSEPESKTNIYYMNLKRCLERRSEESVQNEVKMQNLINMSAKIIIYYVVGARK